MHSFNTAMVSRRGALTALGVVPLAGLAVPPQAGAATPREPVEAAASPLGAPVFSKGLTIDFGGRSYETGPLSGRIELIAAESGSRRAGLLMASPVDLPGDSPFGQVRVTSTGEEAASTEGFTLTATIEVAQTPGTVRESLTEMRAVLTFVPVRSNKREQPTHREYALKDPVVLSAARPLGRTEDVAPGRIATFPIKVGGL